MAGVEIKVVDAKGAKVGTKTAAEAVVKAELRTDLLHEVVRWQRAKRRSGTHTVLTRAEARGGGAKPWKQKGTGRARAGSNTSPLWVGGGIAHGPKQRDYTFSLNRKMKRKALCAAISSRVEESKCLVVKDFGLAEGKTKQAAAALANLGIVRGAKALVVVPTAADAVLRSFRNLPGVRVVTADGVNVYDVLNAEFLVFEEAAFDAVHERLDNSPAKG
jgi:large subunit ribosomal protein L4